MGCAGGLALGASCRGGEPVSRLSATGLYRVGLCRDRGADPDGGSAAARGGDAARACALTVTQTAYRAWCHDAGSDQCSRGRALDHQPPDVVDALALHCQHHSPLGVSSRCGALAAGIVTAVKLAPRRKRVVHGFWWRRRADHAPHAWLIEGTMGVASSCAFAGRCHRAGDGAA